MFELKTHFEQVPLETVRKIVDEQLRRETAAVQHQESEKKRSAGRTSRDEGRATAWEEFMAASFDIFRIEARDSVRWLESAETLEDASARVQELVLRSPGEYVVLD